MGSVSRRPSQRKPVSAMVVSRQMETVSFVYGFKLLGFDNIAPHDGDGKADNQHQAENIAPDIKHAGAEAADS